MLSSILPFPQTHLGSSISYSTHLPKSPPIPTITLRSPPAIRMGGGPRTFPGGVSKWQWKRMQAQKAKQLLKARLCRERQIYEMRKRAELKAAVSELERPWEVVVERSPNLFSIKADDQVKVLADRFQRVGGFDMWSENDGPVVFRNSAVDGVPSARFFPKGVVHSVKPYGVEVEEEDGGDGRNRNLMRRRDNISGLNPGRPKGRVIGGKVEHLNSDSEEEGSELDDWHGVGTTSIRNGGGGPSQVFRGGRRRAVVDRKPDNRAIYSSNSAGGRQRSGKHTGYLHSEEGRGRGRGPRGGVVGRNNSGGRGGRHSSDGRGGRQEGGFFTNKALVQDSGSIWDEDDLKAI